MSPLRRRLLVAWWRIVNPPTRALAGLAPWWVLLETKGARTGKRRRTPLAAGPTDDGAMWLLAVHGRSAGWVRNLEATPRVRIRHRGRWREATAAVHPMGDVPLERFNAYARSGRLIAMDPLLVRLTF
ncbi:MAG: hypothetical protein QOE05_1000 [Actinomycetota bacterium]|jgi:deazaflavin-dependent oxidoreductase (nitroreductase family)|nr:hypothetical protein [Actinomycetota bacterium]